MNKSKVVVVLTVLAVAALSLSMSSPLFANALFPDRPSTAPELASTLVFNPIADAYVQSTYPTTNYGLATQNRVDGSPLVYSYLRFTVTGVSGTVTQATLKIYANSALASGYQAHRVASNAWVETTINYNNRPAMGTLIGSSGAVAAGTWTSINVTSYITGNGTFSFGLTDTSTTALSLASRHSTNKPQLVITTSSVTPPTATKVPPTATKVGPTATKVPPTATSRPPSNTPTPSGSDPILLVTGDSRSGCNAGSTATANLLSRYPSSTLLLFNGDATSTGAASEFTSCFDTTFGKYKAQIRPVPGNHEYMTSGASGYFGYYGTQAHSPGYYSFNVGTWHIVALNSEIDISATSAQMTWLKNDLAAHPTQCSIAYWHEPRWSSGNHGNNSFVSALWTTLYNANVELVFNGHDHDYERFAPMNPSGALDNARGIREFVVGTAGAPPYSVGSSANSQARMSGQYGLIQLTLHPSSYDWKWIAGTGTFTDSGSGTCH